jgi:hypothetical protein
VCRLLVSVHVLAKVLCCRLACILDGEVCLACELACYCFMLFCAWLSDYRKEMTACMARFLALRAAVHLCAYVRCACLAIARRC